MSNLLSRAGYAPLGVESIEAGKVEVAKLPPGAVIITAMRLPDGTAKEFINWLKTEGFGFPVIAIVDNLGNMDAIDVMLALCTCIACLHVLLHGFTRTFTFECVRHAFLFGYILKNTII